MIQADADSIFTHITLLHRAMRDASFQNQYLFKFLAESETKAGNSRLLNTLPIKYIKQKDGQIRLSNFLREL